MHLPQPRPRARPLLLVVDSSDIAKIAAERCVAHSCNIHTSESVSDTFPWPQRPTRGQIAEVAAPAVALRALRREVMAAHGWSLRELYRTLSEPGDNPLRTAQARLDTAVRTAYGFAPKADPLAALFELNQACASKEQAGEEVTPPGIPLPERERAAFITDDCIRVADPH